MKVSTIGYWTKTVLAIVEMTQRNLHLNKTRSATASKASWVVYNKPADYNAYFTTAVYLEMDYSLMLLTNDNCL